MKSLFLWSLLFVLGAAQNFVMPASQVTAAEIQVGQMAPDFKLPGQDGKTHQLSDYKGKKNVVLVLSRAHWCPYCMKHLKALQADYAQYQKMGTEVIVIFREEKDGQKGLDMSQKTTGAEFVLLNDPNAAKTKDYKSFAIYIIDTEGNVKAIEQGEAYNRVAVEKIMSDANMHMTKPMMGEKKMKDDKKMQDK
jgi:peroxiredoxin